MSDLNRDLKDYLSKSNAGDSSSESKLFSGFKSDYNISKWFKGSSGGGYASLPTTDTQTADGNRWWVNDDSPAETNISWLPSLSKKQRIIGFIVFAALGMFCLGMASLLIPFLVLKARKFALLYSLGSLFLISSFSVLWGPASHVKHLCKLNRLPFTLAYFGTLAATIYFSLVMRNTIATVLCAVAQIIALVWYVASYLPGGQTGFKFFTKVFSSGVSSAAKKALPV